MGAMLTAATSAPPPTCRHPCCPNKGRSNGFCMRHGGKKEKQTCQHAGCTKKVVNSRRCRAHGAKRGHKTCSHRECCNAAVRDGVCLRHDANDACIPVSDTGDVG